ncbi:MAG TPA: polysaccharide lyase family protein [Candidatus Acidoferrales bacterium]|jgi:rhamnogalacturonan endolyase|nr:polysaccharide lyase family protein [Candidatus Acidoferrales bacterium]
MRFTKPALVALAILLPTVLQAAPAPVTVSEDDNSFSLDNGIVTARVSKRSGDLVSLEYKTLQMLDAGSGRQEAYWSHNAARAAKIVPRITIDPKTNGGERGEVSVKGVSGGNQMGSGPGGTITADIEIRYALGRGESGVYTYSIFSHPTNYPATSLGEARFCMKLNDDIFDWMTVDANRNMKMITTYDWNHATQMNMKEARRMNTGIYKGEVEHKYDYSANQFDVRAWGWTSTEKKIGLWLVNPSVEYLSGGPTKYELSSHRDATFNTNNLTAPAPPTLLNYWRSSHYGGSICNVGTNDAWTKVIGPFLIYCNSAEKQEALWPDALAQADKEAKAWPFDWVQGVDYPHKNERATVTGKIVLNDPQAPDLKLKNLLVGLTAPDYTPAIITRGPRTGRPGARGGGGGGFGLAGGGDDEAAMTNLNTSVLANTNAPVALTNTNSPGGTNGFRGRFGGGGGFGLPRIVEWQNDARNYEFWVRADENGTFSIPNVRPGNYTLHAIADGVLGDLAVTNINVASGKNLPLGNVDWQPVRFGKQLWDIGIPNRKASEFFKGDDYFHWGWYLQYPKLFPLDVNYVVGKSDYRKDWFFEQLPYNTDTNNTTGNGRGDGTTWAVIFNLTNPPQGKATLRLALCGIGTRTITGIMNDQPIGSVTNLMYNATINRDGIGGSWCERDLAFDASLMKAGTNTLELTIPPGGLTSGIMYDYLRLELDEHASSK